MKTLRQTAADYLALRRSLGLCHDGLKRRLKCRSIHGDAVIADPGQCDESHKDTQCTNHHETVTTTGRVPDRASRTAACRSGMH